MKKVNTESFVYNVFLCIALFGDAESRAFTKLS